MLDFCYLNTYMTVVCCVLAFVRVFFGVDNPLHEYNEELIRAAFAFANGALLLAVPMFNNKLVFHDVDNTVSVFIHLSPPLMMWTLRWGGGYGTSAIEDAWGGMFHVCRHMHQADGFLKSWSSMLWYTDHCEGSISDFVLYPAIVWVVFWGIPYYLLTFCFFSGYIERNNKATLFKDVAGSPKGMGMVVALFPEPLKPFGYMLTHFVWTLLAGTLSILLWHSFAGHTLLLLGIKLFAVHNGSVFMFRVVAARKIAEKVRRIVESPYQSSVTAKESYLPLSAATDGKQSAE